MEILWSMVRNIVVIILVATFLELVIPVGSLRPLTRMIVGLFVILAVLSPLLSTVFTRQTLSLEAFSLPAASAEVQRAMAEGQKLNQGLSSDLAGELKKRQEGQIRSLGMVIPGVAEVSPRVVLDADGRVSRVNLVVRTETDAASGSSVTAFGQDRGAGSEQEEIKKRLRAWMESFYGLAPEKVNITFE